MALFDLVAEHTPSESFHDMLVVGGLEVLGHLADPSHHKQDVLVPLLVDQGFEAIVVAQYIGGQSLPRLLRPPKMLSTLLCSCRTFGQLKLSSKGVVGSHLNEAVAAGYIHHPHQVGVPFLNREEFCL